MRAICVLATLASAAALSGCGLLFDAGQINPFNDYTEAYGATDDSNRPPPPGSGGGSATQDFRDTVTLTLQNVDGEAELNVSLAAWVEPSSIRTAEQADALISAGYVQLGREEKIGDAYVLAPGTFVFNGPGLAGTTPLVVQPGDGEVAGELVLSLLTPDVLLLYSAPPTSCESPGFIFTIDGFPLGDIPNNTQGSPPATADSGGTEALGIKTLAMFDAYECDPLRPGLFFKSGGGAKQPNEYFEGENITVTFSRLTVDNVAAQVTIGG